jgi:hypothetical protein
VERGGSSAPTRSKKTQQERAKLRKEQVMQSGMTPQRPWPNGLLLPKKPKKDKDEGGNEAEDELPEVDQNTNKSLRQRK